MKTLVQFLGRHRYNKYANEVFQYEPEILKYDPTSDEFKRVIGLFINKHTNNQAPRLEELKRYYLHDNNIHYRRGKRNARLADNRIASDYARYITTFMQGYILGNPVKYQTEDKKLDENIVEFNEYNHVDYHDSLIETDLSIYGRAYELLTFDTDGQPRVIKLSPEQTFVVYDDSVDPQPLFGVRYYALELGNDTTYFVECYVKGRVVKFSTKSESYGSLGVVYDNTNDFEGVQINEYKNNDDRIGDYENVLDNIDAYDLSQSELANFQQDSNDSLLVIKGNPYTGTNAPEYEQDENGEIKLDEDGEPIPSDNSGADVLDAMLKANILILDDNPNPDGAQPDAQWLVKQYDSAGSEQYKARIVADILRFTFTPDTNDQNFAGTQSGEAMKYKLLGNDNLRKVKERLLSSGFKRRLKLLSDVWNTGAPDVNIVFTPNLPEDQSAQVDMAAAIHGIVSNETVVDMLTDVTGVDSKDEMKRLKQQQKDQAQAFGGYPTGNEQPNDDSKQTDPNEVGDGDAKSE